MKFHSYIAAVLFLILLSVPAAYAEESTAEGETSHIALVKESKTAGNYTYLRIEEEGKEVWIASMPAYLRVRAAPGDKVEYLGGIMMNNFKSKGMDMTFDSILFVSRIRVLKENGDSMPADDVHKQVGKQEAVTPSEFTAPAPGEIAKAEGGKTVGEIFKEKDTLKDKELVLKAKVMKISKNILGKNWLTVTDGTGVSPDDKIIVLTTAEADVNDTITVRGTVKTDVHLGAGYSYSVLLDNSEIIGK